MKTKEEAITDGFYDLMYSTKTIKEVLGEVYECGFANGFKQGNDNAREVAELEKKKEANKTIEENFKALRNWLVEHGYYVGNHEVAEALRKLADDLDD